MMEPEKLEARRQWNRSPIGTRGGHLEGLEFASREFFEAIRASRYEASDPWMRRVIPFEAMRGKRLLEVGHGLGIDLLTFAEAGAEVHGVDITERHHELAKRNFELHGVRADLRLADAADLPYPDEAFDVVYSHGVLHHTPDPQRCVAEAHRVLRPGGLFILGLYHKLSGFHLFAKILDQGLRQGDLRRLGYRGLMATTEQGADGLRVRPLVRTYTTAGVRHLLRKFARVDTRVVHFGRDHLGAFSRFVPARWERRLEPYLGWYVIAFATK